MGFLLVFCGLIPNPTNPSITECDVIEFNVVCLTGGEIYLVQWIFWELDGGRQHVVSLKKDSESDRLYRRRDGWDLHISDRHLRYIVRSPVLKRSVTNYDPERVDRKYLDILDRTGLNRPDSLLREILSDDAQREDRHE